MILRQDLLLEDLRIWPAIVFSALQRQDISFRVPAQLLGLLPPATIGDPAQFVLKPVTQTVAEQTLDQPFYKGRGTHFLGPAAPVAVSGQILHCPVIGVEELVQALIAAHGQQCEQFYSGEDILLADLQSILIDIIVHAKTMLMPEEKGQLFE